MPIFTTSGTVTQYSQVRLDDPEYDLQLEATSDFQGYRRRAREKEPWTYDWLKDFDHNTLFYDEFHSPLALLPQYKDISIVTNSFSKGYRMYTKRVGFAILPEELQRNLRVMQQHTLLCTDPCYQYGMIAALADEESPAQLTGVYRSRAEYTTQRLTGTGCEPIAAEGGFYAMLRCGEWNAARGFATSKELARDILEKVHVAVVPGTDFGVPNDLRLAFCNERYNEGIDRLRTYFTSSVGKKRLPRMQRTEVVAPGAEA